MNMYYFLLNSGQIRTAAGCCRPVAGAAGSRGSSAGLVSLRSGLPLLAGSSGAAREAGRGRDCGNGGASVPDPGSGLKTRANYLRADKNV